MDYVYTPLQNENPRRCLNEKCFAFTNNKHCPNGCQLLTSPQRNCHFIKDRGQYIQGRLALETKNDKYPQDKAFLKAAEEWQYAPNQKEREIKI